MQLRCSAVLALLLTFCCQPGDTRRGGGGRSSSRSRGSSSGSRSRARTSSYGHTIIKSTSTGSWSSGSATRASYGHSSSQYGFTNFATSAHSGRAYLGSAGTGRVYFFYAAHHRHYGVRQHFGDDICVAKVGEDEMKVISAGRPSASEKRENHTVIETATGNYIYWDCEKGEYCDEEDRDCGKNWLPDWFDDAMEIFYIIAMSIVLICKFFACVCCGSDDSDSEEAPAEAADV